MQGVSQLEVQVDGLLRDLPTRAQVLQGRQRLLVEDRQLGPAADEAREAARRRGLHARPQARRAGQLVDLDRLAHPLDRDRADRLRANEPLGEPERIGRQPDAAGGGELLHAGGQVRRLADRRVLHVEVVADRPDHHLPRMGRRLLWRASTGTASVA
ncbi:MAG TPA: hypothetical protein VF406_21700 [Thermodesulfobacteriota bacterium]